MALAATRALGAVAYPAVTGDATIEFPRDHGSHPDYRTEWWYVTAVLREHGGAEVGVQVTFFRSRPGIAEESRSRFAPKQLLFAHAAVALPSATGRSCARIALMSRASRHATSRWH